MLYPVLDAALSVIGGLAVARAMSLVEMLDPHRLLYRLDAQPVQRARRAVRRRPVRGDPGDDPGWSCLATNDAVSLCLLAVASWMVVRTASWRWRAYMLAMPVACLAAATDYWALLYLPTLALLAALAAHPYLAGLAPVMGAIMVEVVAAGVAVAGRGYVTAAVAATASRAAGSGGALTVLTEAGKWGGLIAALAVLGVVGYSIRARNEPNENVALPGTRRRRIALGVALAGTALLTLADQLYLNTDLSRTRIWPSACSSPRPWPAWGWPVWWGIISGGPRSAWWSGRWHSSSGWPRAASSTAAGRTPPPSSESSPACSGRETATWWRTTTRRSTT